MKKPFGLFSDPHFHAWSSFSEDDPDGVSLRLRGLLGELKRCAEETRKAGGNRIYCGGDVFHTRGQVSPLVLNPVLDTLTELTERGFEFRIISGNHDLARRDSERLSSAVTALETEAVEIVNATEVFTDDKVAMIPWYDKVSSLHAEIVRVAELLGPNVGEYTLIIHAPVNGVIQGLPDTGIDPAWLAERGFKRILSGHYHNYKQFPGEVYSIGALAHHTWSDVGTKAGFLLVHDDTVKFFKSHLPEFLDLDQLAEFESEDVPLMVDGNYVRVKTEKSAHSEIEAIRAELISWGAKGVLIRSMPKARVTREGGVSASVSGGASIFKSVEHYIAAQAFSDKKAVNDACARILSVAGVSL